MLFLCCKCNYYKPQMGILQTVKNANQTEPLGCFGGPGGPWMWKYSLHCPKAAELKRAEAGMERRVKALHQSSYQDTGQTWVKWGPKCVTFDYFQKLSKMMAMRNPPQKAERNSALLLMLSFPHLTLITTILKGKHVSFTFLAHSTTFTF